MEQLIVLVFSMFSCRYHCFVPYMNVLDMATKIKGILLRNLLWKYHYRSHKRCQVAKLPSCLAEVFSCFKRSINVLVCVDDCMGDHFRFELRKFCLSIERSEFNCVWSKVSSSRMSIFSCYELLCVRRLPTSTTLPLWFDNSPTTECACASELVYYASTTSATARHWHACGAHTVVDIITAAISDSVVIKTTTVSAEAAAQPNFFQPILSHKVHPVPGLAVPTVRLGCPSFSRKRWRDR